jgi:hypothetical protein
VPLIAALEELGGMHYELLNAYLQSGGGGMFYLDWVVIAMTKRSVDLIDAAIALVDRWNFTASAPLLRLQLDNVLRLTYLSNCKNAEEVCHQLIAGIRMDKLKDEEGKRLTDRRLCEIAQEHFPSIDGLYGETSRMVHLSNKHWFGS